MPLVGDRQTTVTAAAAAAADVVSCQFVEMSPSITHLTNALVALSALVSTVSVESVHRGTTTTFLLLVIVHN